MPKGVYERKPCCLGHKAWNKDLTKETDERLARFSKIIEIAMNRPEVKEKSRKAAKIFNNLPEVQAKKRATKIKNGTTEKVVCNRPEVKEKMIKAVTVAMSRPEVKEKERIAFEKRVESSGFPRKYLVPSFNFLTIPIFKALDKILYTRSRYGGTKAGEKKIGLHFVDCFNKKYQFIIEWNEPWHKKEDDIKKRRYILARYPDYTYITIKQDRWFKKGNLTEEIAGKIVDHVLEKLKNN